MRNPWSGALTMLGATLVLISCLSMLAMLPAGFVTVLSLIGLTAAPIVAWAAPLAPMAPFLFIASTALLVVGHLRCGWQPASVVAAGGLLVYLAMYVLVVPPQASPDIPSTPMPSMTQTMPSMEPTTSADTVQVMPNRPSLTNAPLFYAGFILIVGSFGLIWQRRTTKACRPFNPLGALRSIFAVRRN